MNNDFKKVYINEKPSASFQQKTIGEVVSELKAELKQFLNTRLQILKSEINSKSRVWKLALPLAAAGLLLGLFAFFILNFALVALIAALFMPSAFAWFFGALIVSVIYAVAGGLLFFLGKREIKAEGLVPVRTMRVLKQDQIWLENETRSA